MFDLLWAKMKILNFVLEEKLYLHSVVKLYGNSDGDGPEAKKPYLDPLIDSYLPLV
jgi:hypothetical protein